MDTRELINALSADAGTKQRSMSSLFLVATGAAVIVAYVMFMLLCGPRPDFAAALQTLRFLCKLAVTGMLAFAAFAALRTLARPEGRLRRHGLLLAAAPLLMGAAVATELVAVPSGEWMTRLLGSNSLVCLGLIPAIGVLPLGILLLLLRQGAPTRPALAGAMAGLLAGGIAATFYAAHCFDDSPLFVATWYTLAVAILVSAGAAVGRFTLRW